MRPLTGILMLGCCLCVALALPRPSSTDPFIRYVALGDSYTAGTGVPTHESWPMRLTRRLQAVGQPIQLVANLARNGATVENVLKEQLPLLADLRPDFVTLQVGVNDWVRSTGSRRYRDRLHRLIRSVLEVLPDSRRLLLVSLPDFSCSPRGRRFGYGKSATHGMQRFNGMIRDAATRWNLRMADVFPASRRACGNAAMYAPDGLHPSGAQYALWEEAIVPPVREILSAGAR